MRGRHLPKSVFYTEHNGAKKKGGRLPRFGSRVQRSKTPIKLVVSSAVRQLVGPRAELARLAVRRNSGPEGYPGAVAGASRRRTFAARGLYAPARRVAQVRVAALELEPPRTGGVTGSLSRTRGGPRPS